MLHDTVALIAYEEPEVLYPCQPNKLQFNFMQLCAILMYGLSPQTLVCTPDHRPSNPDCCRFGEIRESPKSVLIVSHSVDFYACLAGLIRLTCRTGLFSGKKVLLPLQGMG